MESHRHLHIPLFLLLFSTCAVSGIGNASGKTIDPCATTAVKRDDVFVSTDKSVTTIQKIPAELLAKIKDIIKSDSSDSIRMHLRKIEWVGDDKDLVLDVFIDPPSGTLPSVKSLFFVGTVAANASADDKRPQNILFDVAPVLRQLSVSGKNPVDDKGKLRLVFAVHSPKTKNDPAVGIKIREIEFTLPNK